MVLTASSVLVGVVPLVWLGENLQHGALSRHLERTSVGFDDGEEPRGHATQIGDVLALARLNESRQFLGPVLEQSNALGGHTKQVSNRVDIVDERCREVAHASARFEVQLIGKRAAQNQCLARKKSAIGVEIEVVRHHITRPLVVVPSQRLEGYGNVLVIAIASARRLRKVVASSWPQHIFLATHHAHNLRLQILVAVKWHSGGKLLIGAASREVIFSSKPSEGGLLYEYHQLLLLHTIGMVDVARMIFQAREQPWAGYGSEIKQN